MFAALNTVEPPLVELEATKLIESERPWYAQRLPILEERARMRLDSLSQRLGDGQKRPFSTWRRPTASDWDLTFTWSLSLAAFDDKAELQEFDQTAPEPTSTIRDFRGKQLGCLIVPICH